MGIGYWGRGLNKLVIHVDSTKVFCYFVIMSEDVMVIPLRVPREKGRAWKVEAVKQDKSVQRWILDQLEDFKKVHKVVAEVVPVVGQPVECQHRWGVRNGKSQCLLCGVKP